MSVVKRMLKCWAEEGHKFALSLTCFASFICVDLWWLWFLQVHKQRDKDSSTVITSPRTSLETSGWKRVCQ